MKFIRIKPFNPRTGQLLRSYSCSLSDRVFRIEKGWHQVSDKIAEHLSTVRSDPEDPRSPLAFDVVDTQEEADDLTANDPPPVTPAPEVRPRVKQPTVSDARAASERAVADDSVAPGKKSRKS